jgi:hypothetical protein
MYLIGGWNEIGINRDGNILWAEVADGVVSDATERLLTFDFRKIGFEVLSHVAWPMNLKIQDLKVAKIIVTSLSPGTSRCNQSASFANFVKAMPRYLRVGTGSLSRQLWSPELRSFSDLRESCQPYSQNSSIPEEDILFIKYHATY